MLWCAIHTTWSHKLGSPNPIVNTKSDPLGLVVSALQKVQMTIAVDTAMFYMTIMCARQSACATFTASDDSCCGERLFSCLYIQCLLQQYVHNVG